MRIIFASLVMAAAAWSYTQGVGTVETPAAKPKPAAQVSQRNASGRKTVRVRGDDRGHFQIRVKMNGRASKVLLDTGASLVAINEKTARRIGIRPKKSDYTATVSTANGRLRAAPVTIRSIRVGTITVRNVEAVVLPDDALESTLLGMAFLKHLHRFHVQRNVLTLEG